MSKGMDQKRDTKKKPAKSLLEKRAAKAEKTKNGRQAGIPDAGVHAVAPRTAP
jgi:hypothetical protein